MKLQEVAAHLGRFVQAHYGPSAEVDGLEVMQAGHAGLTFGFCVIERADARALARLVLKLSPPGVRRAGNTDVFRQAPLLRALHAAGLPVPDVPWAGDDETWFGTPFVMMEFLPGTPFFVWQPDRGFDRSPHAVAALWEQCIDALVKLHRFDWQRHLTDWERPTPLHDEITRWDRILAKAPDPAWVAAGGVVVMAAVHRCAGAAASIRLATPSAGLGTPHRVARRDHALGPHPWQGA